MEKDLFMGNCQLMFGDCLERMKEIPDGSIDMILCDLPYGTTDCSWDSKIPIDKLWEQYNRILKRQGSVLLFGTEPFSSYLRTSNIRHYKYDWIWKKNTCTGFQHSKNMPLKDFEIISVFSNASMGHISLLGDNRMVYNPQGIIQINKKIKNGKRNFVNIVGKRPSHKDEFIQEYTNYPTMTLNYSKDNSKLHPTQKPVALIEYLIKTYTNEGEIVLDNTFGSCSTGVAAVNTNRKFIGIEMDENYFNIACKRIKEAINEKKQQLF